MRKHLYLLLVLLLFVSCSTLERKAECIKPSKDTTRAKCEKEKEKIFYEGYYHERT
ncbi:MAG: hypothetical protein M9962_14655 [Oligoflexia bacterium]|nr:hypothetical protein [Oligoflexia bacterium]